MRISLLLSLSLAVSTATGGCGNDSEPETVEVVLDPIEVPANVNEAELVFYNDPTSPILLDIWLPPNDEGATLAQFHGDQATGSVEKVFLYRGEERVAVLRIGAEGPVGTTLELASGVTAHLESVEGAAWTWTVSGPSGEHERVRTIMPDDVVEGVPISNAVLQGAWRGWRGRPVTIAFTRAEAPLSVRLPDGAPPWGFSVFSNNRGTCTTSIYATECDVYIYLPNNVLRVETWVPTDLTLLPGNGLVFATIEDCKLAVKNLGIESIAVGAGVSAAGAVAVATYAVTGAVLVAGSGFTILAGVVAGLYYWEAGPECVEVNSNEQLVDYAFNAYDRTTVTASFNWRLDAEDVFDGWTVKAEPEGATFMPFLHANRGWMELDPIVVTVAKNETQEAGSTLAGSVFTGELPGSVFSAYPEADWEGPITVTVGADMTATVDFRASYRTNNACYQAEGSSPSVVVGTDGSFQTIVPYDGSRFDGGLNFSGDPCAQLEAWENEIELAISGRLDASTGPAMINVKVLPEARWENTRFEVLLVREDP